MAARDGVVMSSDDNTYRLVIREAQESDAGVYKCILRNAAGETACTATLSVQSTMFHFTTYMMIIQRHAEQNGNERREETLLITVVQTKVGKFSLQAGLRMTNYETGLIPV